jgi:hypothetical protein
MNQKERVVRKSNTRIDLEGKGQQATTFRLGQEQWMVEESNRLFLV